MQPSPSAETASPWPSVRVCISSPCQIEGSRNVADFSQLNLKDDVENASERFGLAPSMEARFGRNPLGLAGGGFSYQKLAPNFRSPVAHRHRTQEEVYVR